MHTYLCIVASGKCVIFCLRGSYDESAESILQYTVYTCETCVVFVVGSHSSCKHLSICTQGQSCRDVIKICYSVHWRNWLLFAEVRHTHMHGSSVSESIMLDIECKCKLCLYLNWRQLIKCQGIVARWIGKSSSCSLSSNWVIVMRRVSPSLLCIRICIVYAPCTLHTHEMLQKCPDTVTVQRKPQQGPLHYSTGVLDAMTRWAFYQNSWYQVMTFDTGTSSSVNPLQLTCHILQTCTA